MIARLPVDLAETAISDIEAATEHLLRQGASVRIATAFARRIKTRCLKIGDVPRGGRLREDLMPGLRTVPFERAAVICYLIRDDRILITNIFRAGRDFEAILRGDPQSAEDE